MEKIVKIKALYITYVLALMPTMPTFSTSYISVRDGCDLTKAREYEKNLRDNPKSHEKPQECICSNTGEHGHCKPGENSYGSVLACKCAS